MQYRPLCKLCNAKPAAINYFRNGIPHFRKSCDSCSRKKKKQKPPKPSWVIAGYKKKPHCEKCGFRAKYANQLFVYFIDGNLSNTSWTNLRTICANCQIAVAREGLGWRQGDLIPDV